MTGGLGGVPARKVSGTDDEDEAYRFYTYATVVFVILAIALYQAPPVPAGGKCDDVSVLWLVSGVAPKFLGGRGDLLGTLQSAFRCAEAYNGANPRYTLGILSSLYIGLQSFAIPGPHTSTPSRP